MRVFLLTMFSLLVCKIGITQNVGIGTSSPAEKFTILTSVNRWGLLHTDGTIQIGTFANQFFGGYLGTKSNHATHLITNGSPGLTLFTNGNISAGTLFSDARFHISNPDGPTDLVLGRRYNAEGYTSLRLGTSALSNGYSFLQSVGTGGTVYGNLILNSLGGNVGIGTSSPSATLEVDGDVLINGSLKRRGVDLFSLVPVCMGNIQTTGNYTGGTGNFSSQRIGPGHYRIIQNQLFDFSIICITPTLVNVAAYGVERHNGYFDVRFNVIANSTTIQVDTDFSFVIFSIN